MIPTYRLCSPLAVRWSAPLLATLLAALFTQSASAGFVVGTANGNDSHADVLAVVNTYNASNDPDLPTDFDLFKKTDDDAAFVFNLANDFKFYKDALLTMQIFTEAELTSLTEAWFTYDGPENILYYTDKSGPRFTVWTYMAGANHIDIPSTNQEISHSSFFIGDRLIPEPGSLALAACGIVGALVAVMRRRIS